jgi:hypothetical protein
MSTVVVRVTWVEVAETGVSDHRFVTRRNRRGRPSIVYASATG